MRHEPIDPTLFIENRRRLRSLLQPDALAIVNANDRYPSSGDATLPYKPNADLFYLTGIEQEESVLLICPDSGNKRLREVLFILEPDPSLKTWEGEKLSREKATAISGIKEVKGLGELEPTLRRLACEAERVYLNANEHVRAARMPRTRDERFTADFKEMYPIHEYKRLAPLLTRLRTVKSKPEIELIRRAISITREGLLRAFEKIRPGFAEYQIEAEFAHEFTRSRASFAFSPIVASGASTCVLHYLDNNRECSDGDLLLLDIGACYANYNADLTRTVPVNGKFSKRQREIYEAVLRVMRAMIAAARPGTLQRDWQAAAELMMNEELLGLGLISQDDIDAETQERHACRKYFMHGIGHSLGLDVHDAASPNTPFEPGWVLTVEPGIYIPEEEIGIRIENNILITDDEPVDLSAGVPVEADEIEDLIRGRR